MTQNGVKFFGKESPCELLNKWKFCKNVVNVLYLTIWRDSSALLSFFMRLYIQKMYDLFSEQEFYKSKCEAILHMDG